MITRARRSEARQYSQREFWGLGLVQWASAQAADYLISRVTISCLCPGLKYRAVSSYMNSVQTCLSPSQKILRPSFLFKMTSQVPQTPNTKIAVLGGGPAGMATALALLKAGHNVTVYERYKEARPAGNILNLWSIASRARQVLFAYTFRAERAKRSTC